MSVESKYSPIRVEVRKGRISISRKLKRDIDALHTLSNKHSIGVRHHSSIAAFKCSAERYTVNCGNYGVQIF